MCFYGGQELSVGVYYSNENLNLICTLNASMEVKEQLKGSVEKGDKCFLPTLKVKGQPYGHVFSESIKAGS